MIELNIQSNRDGRLLADGFTILASDDQDWHGQSVRIYLRGAFLGTARVQMATSFYAERLTDQNTMIVLGISKMKAKQTYMMEFGDIAATTKLVYLALQWMERDLTAFGTVFNSQWAKLVEEKESKIQTSAA